MLRYRIGILLIGFFAICAEGVNPNPPSSNRSGSKPTTNRRNGIKNNAQERIREVEAIDDGLLQSNFTENKGSASSNLPLGKQFNGVPGGTFGTPFGTEPFPNSIGNSFQPGGNSFLPGQPVPGTPTGFAGQQPGGFPFPGQQGGILPGAGLPPGAVSPDTVAFSAARASDFTRVGITQVRFDYTITDIGYGWYPDRSEFVCYYPGLYFFTFSGLSTQTRQIKMSLVKNNQEVVSAWGDANGYQMASNSAILTLNQGDRVYIILQEGNLHETNNNVGRGYTTFSGFRIR